MDKSELIKEIQSTINTLYFVINGADAQWIEDELYPAVYTLEKVLTSIENQDDN